MESVTLICKARGRPAPNITFYSNTDSIIGSVVPPCPYQVETEGRVTVNVSDCQQTGLYRCEAGNTLPDGRKSSTVFLNTTCPPEQWDTTFSYNTPTSPLNFTLKANPPPYTFRFTHEGSRRNKRRKRDNSNSALPYLFRSSCSPVPDKPYLSTCSVVAVNVPSQYLGVFNGTAISTKGTFDFKFQVLTENLKTAPTPQPMDVVIIVVPVCVGGIVIVIVIVIVVVVIKRRRNARKVPDAFTNSSPSGRPKNAYEEPWSSTLPTSILTTLVSAEVNNDEAAVSHIKIQDKGDQTGKLSPLQNDKLAGPDLTSSFKDQESTTTTKINYSCLQTNDIGQNSDYTELIPYQGTNTSTKPGSDAVTSSSPSGRQKNAYEEPWSGTLSNAVLTTSATGEVNNVCRSSSKATIFRASSEEIPGCDGGYATVRPVSYIRIQENGNQTIMHSKSSSSDTSQTLGLPLQEHTLAGPDTANNFKDQAADSTNQDSSDNQIPPIPHCHGVGHSDIPTNDRAIYATVNTVSEAPVNPDVPNVYGTLSRDKGSQQASQPADPTYDHIGNSAKTQHN